jgi:hypothetical protein
MATFLLLGFAGVTMAAAISEKQPEDRASGHAAMVEAEYTLAMALRR